MKDSQARQRAARVSHDYLMMLAMMIIVCIAVVRILTPDQATDPRPLWERVVNSLIGLLQCFGLCIGASVLIASLEVLKQQATKYHLQRIEKRRARLDSLRPMIQ